MTCCATRRPGRHVQQGAVDASIVEVEGGELEVKTKAGEIFKLHEDALIALLFITKNKSPPGPFTGTNGVA